MSSTREPKGRPARRSLSHVGGSAETDGSPAEAKVLARALDVERAPAPSRGRRRSSRSDDPDRVHLHGFHSYPARMHPLTAARLIGELTSPRGLVLDPFCGSGTVLVEALLAGREARGTDLNPLAVMLSSMKVRPYEDEELEELVGVARALRAHADSRRKKRAGATRRYSPEDVALFEPHVLLELDSLRAGIAELEDGPVRRALWLTLSAILVKLSRKLGDTSEETEPRRIAPGFASLFFKRKAEELAGRLGAFRRALPEPPPRGEVRLDDAARLKTVRPASGDAIITSPPYLATYDYLGHHALRLRWLGLDERQLSSHEMGSRRSYAHLSPQHARDLWISEVHRFLEAAVRVTRPGSPVVLLLADSAVGKAAAPPRSRAARGPRLESSAVRGDEVVRAAITSLPLELVARASQERPHFHRETQAAFRRAPRREHAILLVRGRERAT